MTAVPCFVRMGAAPAAFGHRAYMGAGVCRPNAPMPAARGHRSYSGPPPAPVAHNNMAAMVAAVIAERRRQALYLGDERAPEFGPRHRNFFAPAESPHS